MPGRKPVTLQPGYLSIRMFARKAGVSEKHIYNHLQEYSPIKNKYDEWLLPESAITRVTVARVGKRGRGKGLEATKEKADALSHRKPGMIAAAAMRHFEAGRSTLYVIANLEISVNEAKQLRRDYEELRVEHNIAVNKQMRGVDPYGTQAQLSEDGQKIRLSAFVDFGEAKETYVLTSEWYELGSPEGKNLEPKGISKNVGKGK